MYTNYSGVVDSNRGDYNNIYLLDVDNLSRVFLNQEYTDSSYIYCNDYDDIVCKFNIGKSSYIKSHFGQVVIKEQFIINSGILKHYETYFRSINEIEVLTKPVIYNLTKGGTVDLYNRKVVNTISEVDLRIATYGI